MFLYTSVQNTLAPERGYLGANAFNIKYTFAVSMVHCVSKGTVLLFPCHDISPPDQTPHKVLDQCKPLVAAYNGISNHWFHQPAKRLVSWATCTSIPLGRYISWPLEHGVVWQLRTCLSFRCHQILDRSVLSWCRSHMQLSWISEIEVIHSRSENPGSLLGTARVWNRFQ